MRRHSHLSDRGRDLVRSSVSSDQAIWSLDLGLTASTFRDYATSPLFYRGTPLHLSVSFLEIDDRIEDDFRLSADLGSYSAEVNDHSVSSQVKVMSSLFKVIKSAC